MVFLKRFRKKFLAKQIFHFYVQDLLFVVIPLLIIYLLAFIFVYVQLKNYLALEAHPQKAIGIVIDKQVYRGKSIGYLLVIEYEANGKRLRETVSVKPNYYGEMDEGDIVEIIYEENNPQNIKTADGYESDMFSIILLVITCLIPGIIVMPLLLWALYDRWPNSLDEISYS